MHKNDSGERYLQRRHGEGLASWVFSSRARLSQPKRWFGGGVELSIAFGGRWRQQSRLSPKRTYQRADIVRLSPGELYTHQYAADGGVVEHVGFVVYGPALAAVCPAGTELCFPQDAGLRDAELYEVARELALREGDVPTDELNAIIARYLRRHAVPVPVDEVAAAKAALERDWAFDLPIEWVAREHGLSHVVFTRALKRRYGFTPARYRLCLRLNWASRLLWHEPSWPIERIAAEVGFREKGYFHRAFRRAFGRTPADARRRFMPSCSSSSRGAGAGEAY